jgi:hypothetical protein
MATFRIGQSIKTDVPGIEVDAGLPLGRHQFRLVVVNDAGRESLPVQALVDIRRLLVVDPLDRPVLTDPLDGPVRITRLNRPLPTRPPRRQR